MITVKRSIGPPNPTKYSLTEDQLKTNTEWHITDVTKGMNWWADQLKQRAVNHDHTKTQDIQHFYQSLTSDDMDHSEWWIKHITNERHHLNDHCPKDVDLVDVLEFITDCCMAGMARNGYVYDITLPNEILQLALQNSVTKLKSQIQVVSPDDLLQQQIGDDNNASG